MEQLQTKKAKFEAVKAEKPETWTKQLQTSLDEVIGEIADINEEISELDSVAVTAEVTATPSYVPEKGTEKMVHLKIVKGRRFNPMTGKEVSTPYKQLFTYGEFQLFKKNAKMLGYSVLEVLHDPYGEAKELVVTE